MPISKKLVCKKDEKKEKKKLVEDKIQFQCFINHIPSVSHGVHIVYIYKLLCMCACVLVCVCVYFNGLALFAKF